MTDEKLFRALQAAAQVHRMAGETFFANPTWHNLLLYIVAIDVLGHAANHVSRAMSDSSLSRLPTLSIDETNALLLAETKT